jgi:hypothetical protein
MARSRRRDDDDDRDAAEPPTRSDAYVGLLAISLVALIAGCVFMFLDHDELEKQTVNPPSVTVSEDGLGAAKAAPKS